VCIDRIPLVMKRTQKITLAFCSDRPECLLRAVAYLYGMVVADQSPGVDQPNCQRSGKGTSKENGDVHKDPF
jgi:hypothetical protein